MSYAIKDGAIYSKKGFPLPKQWFADGRLTFSYDASGIECIEYFIPTAKDGNRIMFKRNIFDCFRPSVKIGDRRYTPDYCDLYIRPYGLECSFEADGALFSLEVAAIDGNISFALSGGKPCIFRLTFFETTQFIPAYNGDLDSRDYGLKREWLPWKEKDGALYGGMTEKEKEDKIALSSQGESAVFGSLMQQAENVSHGLSIGIVGNGAARFDRSPVNCRNEILLSHDPLKKTRFAVVFGSDKEDIEAKTAAFIADADASERKQKERYATVQNKLPKIKTPIKAIDDFCAIAPLFHESTKADRNGIIRAKTSRYWSWGWDSMVTNDVTVGCWQDVDLVRGMLDYFEETSNPQKGWAHWFRPDNSVRQYATPAAQGIYISLLYDYVALVNDTDALQKHYPFARKIFDKLLDIEKSGTGLFISPSLVPDYPECVFETGRDISLFNNSVAYNAMRAMEKLACLSGDEEREKKAREIARNAEKNFFALFYDDEKKFLAFSLDADTLEKRRVYSICGYFWDSDFHDDLLGEKVASVVDFVLKNGLNELAFFNYVLWGDTYDKDANQLHATWGVVEEVILRIGAYTGHGEFADRWIKKLTYWMDKLTCPEGESYEFETDDPGYDRWNCDAGSWQTYTIRKWYRMIFRLLLGVSFDEGGVTLSNPHTSYCIENFVLRDKTYSFKTEGEGKEITAIDVNGHNLSHTKKIPVEYLREDGVNAVTVYLGNKAFEGVEKANGVEIGEYKEDEKSVNFLASGLADCTVYIGGDYDVFVDGEKVKTKETDVASSCFRVTFKKGQTYRFSLKKR